MCLPHADTRVVLSWHMRSRHVWVEGCSTGDDMHGVREFLEREDGRVSDGGGGMVMGRAEGKGVLRGLALELRREVLQTWRPL